MSARKRQLPPEDVQRIVRHAQDCEPCETCGAVPGQACTAPGPRRTVCKARFIAAMATVKRQDKAAQRTPAQAAILAGLPRIPKAEIEARRTPAGGYSFTRAWAESHGIPWPLPAGWREAVEREDDGAEGER